MYYLTHCGNVLMLFNTFKDLGRPSVKTGENYFQPDVDIIKTFMLYGAH